MPDAAGQGGFAASLAGAGARGGGVLAARLRGWSLSRALAQEWDERRVFLWLPVAAGTGVLLYLSADSEPSLWLPALLLASALAAAAGLRRQPVPRGVALALMALSAGFLSGAVRTRLVATPMLDRIHIVTLTGTIEEVDLRATGARLLVAVAEAEGLPADRRPRRVRLTTRRAGPEAAGDRVKITARLLPPARAALPGGYDFARDAYFAGIGAVGSVLGTVAILPDPEPSSLTARLHRAVDRERNALARRVDDVVGGGDTGAIAAAMVTGKRDLLSAEGREIIREAGIFHIITIAGVQMTLVAGMIFGATRRLLALSPTLALRQPIKAWAAGVAIAGALAYDLGTGARVGTQRALFMTVIVLAAVLTGRRAMTMRNLALAALAVIAIEPEQIAGASFQLSFAAVAALIAVQEARARSAPPDLFAAPAPRAPPQATWRGGAARAGEKLLHLLTATFFATLATASFMAANFHELSPYVFIGNPLTLAMIEVFAVPGALLGTALYPLGLDAPVWHWVGWGIDIVLAVARVLGAAPMSTLPLRDFAPWALPCLALALLSAVIWRSLPLRLTALPLLALGLAGAAAGPRADLLVAPTGDALAIRAADGRLGTLGHAGAFTAEQWLRADGDARDPAGGKGLAMAGGRCDRIACVAPLPGGGFVSLVTEAAAFAEDCRRALIVVTPLVAPRPCAAAVVLDRLSLAASGAVALRRDGAGWGRRNARAAGEDRPWSPAPPPLAVAGRPSREADDAAEAGREP